MTSKLLHHPAVFPYPAPTCINPLDTLLQSPNSKMLLSPTSPHIPIIALFAELDDSVSVSLHLLQVP